MAKRPVPAELRTIDMFSGKSKLEEAIVASEVIQDAPKEDRVPMEQDVDKMRQRAFQVAEFTDKAFGERGMGTQEENQYRLSLRGGNLYVEILRFNADGKSAYAYAGVMLPERDLYALTTVFVSAAREKKSKEGGKSDGK